MMIPTRIPRFMGCSRLWGDKPGGRLFVPGQGRVPLTDEADDVLDGADIWRGDGVGTLGAVLQNRIDRGRIGDEALHLGADGAELCDRDFDQRILEGRELAAAEL